MVNEMTLQKKHFSSGALSEAGREEVAVKQKSSTSHHANGFFISHAVTFASNLSKFHLQYTDYHCTNVPKRGKLF